MTPASTSALVTSPGTCIGIQPLFDGNAFGAKLRLRLLGQILERQKAGQRRRHRVGVQFAQHLGEAVRCHVQKFAAEFPFAGK